MRIRVSDHETTAWTASPKADASSPTTSAATARPPNTPLPHIQTLERPEAVADALGRFLPAEIDIP